MYVPIEQLLTLDHRQLSGKANTCTKASLSIGAKS